MTSNAAAQNPLHTRISQLSPIYRGIVTVQLANRHWTLQSYETGIFFTVTLAPAALCLSLIRRCVN